MNNYPERQPRTVRVTEMPDGSVRIEIIIYDRETSEKIIHSWGDPVQNGHPSTRYPEKWTPPPCAVRATKEGADE